MWLEAVVSQWSRPPVRGVGRLWGQGLPGWVGSGDMTTHPKRAASWVYDPERARGERWTHRELHGVTGGEWCLSPPPMFRFVQALPPPVCWYLEVGRLGGDSVQMRS